LEQPGQSREPQAVQGDDPSSPPRLIEGRAAFAELRDAMRALLVVVPLFAAQLVLINVDDGSAIRASLLPVVGFVVVILSFAILALFLRMRSAISRERDRGYTTTYFAAYRELWQLDHTTGEVIRRPGDPPVTIWSRSKKG